MAKFFIKKGTTSKLVHIFIQDSSSTTGAGLTGLTSGSTGLVCYRARQDDGNAGGTQLVLSAGTRGTWSSAQPTWRRLHLKFSLWTSIRSHRVILGYLRCLPQTLEQQVVYLSQAQMRRPPSQLRADPLLHCRAQALTATGLL